MTKFQVLGTDELNAYLNKYHLELEPQLDALVGRFVNHDFLLHFINSFANSKKNV